MNKMKFFIVALITISSVVNISCKKDKASVPIVSVTPSPLYYYGRVGDLVTFKITVSSEVTLSKFTIASTIDNQIPVVVLDTNISTKGTSFNYYIRLTNDLSGKSFVLDFKATDSNGKSGGTAKRVYVDAIAPSQAIPLTQTSGHRMYSNNSTVGGDAYNLETNGVENSLVADTASRDMQDYSNTNTTLSKTWISPAGGKFVLFNGYDYANATDSTAINAYNTGVKLQIINNLQVGDIIITKLGSVSTAKYAVIRITDIIDATGKDNDYYEFNIKK